MARILKLDITKLPKVQEPHGPHCCLYVLAEDGGENFKIGVAGHPNRRLTALQGGNRRRLTLVLVYAGTRTNCFEIERSTLRFFGAPRHSEWVYAERLEDIERYLNSFATDDEEPQ